MRIWTDCKLFYFIFYFGRHYSSTLLVLMSIEKCFAAYFPLKSKTVCTVKTAKLSTGIMGVVIIGCNIMYFFVKESRKLSGHYYCDDFGKYRVVLDVADSVLYSFGPFTLICITNSAIAFKFMSSKCRRSQNNFTESTNQALTKSATRGTAMVVTVSVTFLLLTAPTGVDDALTPIMQLGTNPLYTAFMNITQYIKHSINAVLYIIVGSKFRRELFNLFQHKQTPTVYSVNRTTVTSLNGDTA